MRLFALVIMVLLAGQPADAKKRSKGSYSSSAVGRSLKTGAGLYLGQPAGITGKYWLAPELAVNVVLGSWMHPDPGGVLGADFHYNLRDLVPTAKPFELGLYFGGGVGLGWLQRRRQHSHDTPLPHTHTHELQDLLIFIRPLVGANLHFRSAPIELFLEIAPTLRFAPTPSRLDIGGGFGGRYYF